MNAVRVDPFYVFHGVFEDDDQNERPMLRPCENKRVLTLLLCLCRRWDLFTAYQVKTIMYCAVPKIPFYGLDPCVVFESIMDDVGVLRIRTQFYNSVPLHWNIVCKTPNAAQSALEQVGTMFQCIDYWSEFNTDENDTDYEEYPPLVSLQCGYDGEIVINVSVSDEC